MATLQASSVMSSSTSLSSCCRRGMIRGAINVPTLRPSHLSLPNLSTRGLVDELALRSGYTSTTTTHINEKHFNSPKNTRFDTNAADPAVMAKLYSIMEAVADRVEMHNNIGEQRNNWNSLLLTSINAITLGAATMVGITASGANVGAPLMGLKLSSTVLYLAATGMLSIMSKIQPSQLVEEQRNAARLFKQLQGQIQTTISIGTPTIGDVKEFMDKVLALDKAYPLPLLGAMLDKFPSTVEPAVWWPQQPRRQAKGLGRNGWSGELEGELREIVGVLNRNDKVDYLRLGEKALKLNKVLAISGPLLTGLAAIGSAFVGSPSHGSWAAVLGIFGGALASIVNTLEHGGQVGMVFEMYRSNAGFFKLLEESIESNLSEREVGRRENGELLEMKVALQLGRSLSELKNLAASSRKGETTEEFASKLF
ncbi:probable F-box protein At4g22030 [Cornus florida]|uniref:probable F-box protein At4g22030 n=1 Tax=Cornus florida TaxID=4283 RepID=UPI0028A0F522|nr:probable F-box protein At4g22030 [Cornus florida]